MTKSNAKLMCLTANVCVIIFTILYATKVITSFNKEDSYRDLSHNKSLLQKEENGENQHHCYGNMMINLTFAVCLAALWNAKKVMKIGTI